MLRPEVALARTLRRTMSYPDVLLWQRLRGRATGLKFRKRHPIGPYVVDFCCLERRMVLEVDGAYHDGEREYDRARDAFLRENGFSVLRVVAADVQQDMAGVIAAIVSLAASPLHQPSAGPPPRSEEVT